jgi:NAD(P)-dependent dehydrogenase (short-subunit alcohol dehydrogenase family)
MSGALDGRVYLVTGASRGFGLAIAQALVAAGARVALTGRRRAGIEAAAASLGDGKAIGCVADAADAQAIAAALADCKRHFGRLDGVVNNAGLARPGSVETIPAAEVREQVETNFLGTVFCCQAAIPLLRCGDNARIVNISSASAEHHDEMSHLSIYAATKLAVERFSRDLRRELQDDRIGVTILRAGSAPTGFAEGWDPERFLAALAAWNERGTHMDVGMEVTHVAAAVAWCLASPPGVSPDLLEIRPFHRVPKPDAATLMGDG